jgi:hypothetical protein
VIWVTEVWRSQADLDASLERIRGSEDVAATMSPVDDWEMIELELLGGKGPRAPVESCGRRPTQARGDGPSTPASVPSWRPLPSGASVSRRANYVRELGVS